MRADLRVPLFATALFLCTAGPVLAQSPPKTSKSAGGDLESAATAQNERRIQTNQTGMGVLMGWAGLNMAVGSAAFFSTSGRRKYFHQMNAGWNIVNAALATGGLISAANEVPGSYGLIETARQAEFIEKLLLFNAGLDVGYVAFGGFLRERGRRTDSERLAGYGDSLLLQGGFLFAFDLVMFGIHHSNASTFYETIRPMVGPGTGLSFGFSF